MLQIVPNPVVGVALPPVPPTRPQVLRERATAPFSNQLLWPVSYTDFNGAALTLCTSRAASTNGGLCLAPGSDLAGFAGNIGNEGFYYLVSGPMCTRSMGSLAAFYTDNHDKYDNPLILLFAAAHAHR
jgi:hypothetical protein